MPLTTAETMIENTEVLWKGTFEASNPSVSIAKAIMEAADKEVNDVTSLHYSIDCDALKTLLNHNTVAFIRFEHETYDIGLFNTGDMVISKLN